MAAHLGGGGAETLSPQLTPLSKRVPLRLHFRLEGLLLTALLPWGPEGVRGFFRGFCEGLRVYQCKQALRSRRSQLVVWVCLKVHCF